MKSTAIVLTVLLVLPSFQANAQECSQSFTTPSGQTYSVPCGKGKMSPMYMQPSAPSSSYSAPQYRGGGGGNAAMGGALMGLGNAMMNMGNSRSYSDDDDE